MPAIDHIVFTPYIPGALQPKSRHKRSKTSVDDRRPRRRGFSFRKLTGNLGLQKHTHSTSEPKKLPSNFPYPPPTRPAQPIPCTSERRRAYNTLNTTTELLLQSIPETLYESAVGLEKEQVNYNTPQERLSELVKMDESRQSLMPPVNSTKARAIQQAKDMQELVAERVKRSGEEAPPYDFQELIGKGTYGRVFKGVNRNTGGMVAIKIIDIDKEDYEHMTTTGLSDTLKEINILQQLGDSRARPYVNIIEEARPVHNELWIVSEYASGGSISTLMKPNMGEEHQGLDEKFIIPIARELALGLKYIHEAGVLHRDLKCNNILILEDGRVQLCDFGVSGMLEPAKSKRSTIVGTPYWMAPELQKEYVKAEDRHNLDSPTEILYGSEIDIWAYGCTVFEMATGFPPHHRVQSLDLPNAGVPVLEGDRYSQELKDFVSFVFEPIPQNRPTPDQMLAHPYLVNSTKMYPTVMLVKLVEDYYKWELKGGSRVSLFNPYGAQAPEALVATDDDDDDDWTFSTSDEFENRLSRAFPDPFNAPGQNYTGMAAAPEDDDRWKKMQAAWQEESINRGAKKLNRLFDPNSTPYRYSGLDDGGNGRPPSDLILRDFNPGAPNRETVIDLDFAAPVASDVPSIDLGEVPALKASRMQRLLAMEDDDDTFDMDEVTKRATRDWKFPMAEDQDQTAKRATKDWKFPMADDQTVKRATKDWKFPMADDQTVKRATKDWKFPMADDQTVKRATKDWKFPMADSLDPNANRATKDWKFPPMPDQPNRQTKDFQFPPKPNRATREWTFSAAMAEANYQAQRNSRRETRDWKFPTAEPEFTNRKTRDFKFPMKDPEEDGNMSSSPTLDSNFQRPGLKHSSTDPVASFEKYPTASSAPDSPTRTSMIDLDIAMPTTTEFRPSTADSTTTTIRTAVSEQLNDNPFNLEDQVHLSQNNNRASYHMKSQSEPNHAIPGLLTPQTFDDQGQPTTTDPHHPNMHARGVSSASQVNSQLKPPAGASTQPRPSQRSQLPVWEGWSHSAAYGISSNSDDSPPLSVGTDHSDSDIDEAWDALEAQIRSVGRMASSNNLSRSSQHRVIPSRDDDLLRASDAEDGDWDDLPRPIRVSLGPNGKPLVEFPIPRGPDPEALLGVGGGGGGIYAGGYGGLDIELQNALWKSTIELRDGLRASRDLLKAMRLEDVRVDGGEDEAEVEAESRLV